MASRSREKSETYARENGFERSYGSYHALLKDATSWTSVCNPLRNRPAAASETVRALEAGDATCFVKSPMALNVAECRRMIAAAKQNHRLLMEAFMYRLHPQTLKLQEIIQKGVIGDVPSRSCGVWVQYPERERKECPAGEAHGRRLSYGCGMLLRERDAHIFPGRAFTGYGTG